MRCFRNVHFQCPCKVGGIYPPIPLLTKKITVRFFRLFFHPTAPKPPYPCPRSPRCRRTLRPSRLFAAAARAPRDPCRRTPCPKARLAAAAAAARALTGCTGVGAGAAPAPASAPAALWPHRRRVPRRPLSGFWLDSWRRIDDENRKKMYGSNCKIAREKKLVGGV